MKNNNFLAAGIVMAIVTAIGLLMWSSSKNKTNEPAVDQHGMPIAVNTSAQSLNELVNKPAPDFAFADRSGKNYSLDELRGKNIILFFNEGLMCYPSCWNQIVALAKDERFKNVGTVVLSVVIDPLEDWQKAIDKMPELASAVVVFDKGGAVSKKFGALTVPSSMHYGSFPGHSYVLIDKQGVVRYAFDDPNMGIHNDRLVEEIAKINQTP